MPSSPLVALEIGTSRVRALVGEVRDDGNLMVIGCGDCVSAGVRKGDIVDFDHALSSVRSALAQAEDQANVIIREVLLVRAGADLRSSVNRGTVHVFNEQGEITRREIEAVAEAARNLRLPDREVLHSIAQLYTVDGQAGVLSPEGMEGSQLSLDMLIVHGPALPLRNLIKVPTTIPVDVLDVAFSGLCASLAVLTPEQKTNGVAVLDLGGGTTDFLAYADQRVAHAGSLGIGGDHVTNDLALGLRIPSAQAERVKLEHARATVEPEARQKSVTLPADGAFAGRTFRLVDAHLIVHARMEELFLLLRREFDARGLLPRLGAGIVLTGGGAQLRGVVDLAEKVFNLPCMVGVPRMVSGLGSVINQPQYAVPVGLLRYAQMSLEPAPAPGGFLRKITTILQGGRR